MSAAQTVEDLKPLDAPALLDRLGYTAEEHVSVNTQPRGGAFSSRVVPSSTVGVLPTDLNVWLGVNPVRPRTTGRGTASDVTRLAALWADLDVKPGGCPDLTTARQIIDALATMLHARPVAVTFSGHGLQPFWAIEDGWLDTDAQRARARALVRRWGRLVAHVAGIHHSHVDGVFDLARVLRAPGTVNHKATPVPVVTVGEDGRPVSLDEVEEVLLAYNVLQRPGDSEDLGQVLSSPAEWAWAASSCRYAKTTTAAWLTENPSDRHPWLMSAAVRLACTHRYGCLTEADYGEAQRRLVAHFHGLLERGSPKRQADPGEVADAFSWGGARASAKTDEGIAAELGDHPHWDGLEDVVDTPVGQVDTTTGEVLGEPEADEHDDFWTARPELTHIREFARARFASPWATLGAALVRVTCHVEPWHVLPGIIGSKVSVNTFLAIVGKSGDGKGAAYAAARDAIRFDDPLEEIGIGSGEGIAHTYRRFVPPKKDERGHVETVRTRALFMADEVDTLLALSGGRAGSTLSPTLRSAWMGADLGHAYADATKRLALPSHSYRLGLVVGVQPERAAVLLDDAAAGTPQRFLWMPGGDPTIPDVEPAEPEPIRWTPPRARGAADRDGHHVIAVCDTAASTIKSARRARLRGDGTALDGHALLCREKAAAALALLAGRDGVNEQDWALAGVVMDVSDATRAAAQQTLNATKRACEVARGRSQGVVTLAAEEVVSRAAVQRVRRRLLGRITGEWTSSSALRRQLAARDRDLFEDAVGPLVKDGLIERRQVEYQGNKGHEYRRMGRAS